MAKRKSKLGIIIVIILLALALIMAGVWFFLNRSIAPLDADNTSTVMVDIPSGSSTGGIAEILVSNQLIASASEFKMHSRIKGNDGKYKAGMYSLSPSMNMDEIMEVIIAGKQATNRFTIPEGYTVQQTAQKLANDGFGSYDVYMDEIANGTFSHKFMDSLPATANRLEGFLFPNTYDVFIGANEHEILDRMMSQFDVIFTDDYYRRAAELGYNVYDIVTIASLIERETMVDSERAKVASVIYNRISIGMKLQIDATVQYALGEQKDRLYYSDLKIDSPYNTYLVPGLPAGPICSPSAESIYAALYPEETNYLFYVLKPELDGTHNFAETEKEFTNYKNQYIKSLG